MDAKQFIPHRDPFLFVDEILEINENSIKTIFYIKKDAYYFKGHYPNNPIMPGVLMVESALQAGAVLLSNNLEKNDKNSVPVVTRIQDVKFKNMVVPDDKLEISTTIKESLNSVYFLKSKIINSNKKTVLTMNYAVTLVEKEN